jgi:hypothetical protein
VSGGLVGWWVGDGLGTLLLQRFWGAERAEGRGAAEDRSRGLVLVAVQASSPSTALEARRCFGVGIRPVVAPGRNAGTGHSQQRMPARRRAWSIALGRCMPRSRSPRSPGRHILVWRPSPAATHAPVKKCVIPSLSSRLRCSPRARSIGPTRALQRPSGRRSTTIARRPARCAVAASRGARGGLAAGPGRQTGNRRAGVRRAGKAGERAGAAHPCAGGDDDPRARDQSAVARHPRRARALDARRGDDRRERHAAGGGGSDARGAVRRGRAGHVSLLGRRRRPTPSCMAHSSWTAGTCAAPTTGCS